MSKNIAPMLRPEIPMIPPPQQLMHPNKHMFKPIPPSYIPPAHITESFPEWRRVPIQLTIPSAPGVGDGNRMLSIDVPEVFLQGFHLKSILTGNHTVFLFITNFSCLFKMDSTLVC